MIKLPQPFKINDIDKKTKAVVIALLMGFLLILSTVIGVLFNRMEDKANLCKQEKKELYDLILTERKERIQLYENMLFYKQKSQYLQAKTDSIVERTKPLVNQILNR
ncbi:hypothetical protein ACILDT_11480 [Capnocytophaga canis]|uniref:hypothetical protein n=1 Tax=Capnocytophaga TaxID=1016 RepID=UPI00156218FA|nr:hypothetical protein [Capnocytophaga canis]